MATIKSNSNKNSIKYHTHKNLRFEESEKVWVIILFYYIYNNHRPPDMFLFKNTQFDFNWAPTDFCCCWCSV